MKNSDDAPLVSVRTPRKVFSRDINYLRDLILAWPFIIGSIVAVSCAFSPNSRQLALTCAALAILALLLMRERVVWFFGGMAFVAIRGAIWLIIRPWSWATFAATVLTGIPFLVANRYWRKPRFSYQIPDADEFGAVDVLLSLASICGTLFLMYLISPNKWGIR